MIRKKSALLLTAVGLAATMLASACGTGQPDDQVSDDVNRSVPADAVAANPDLAPVTIGFRNLEGGSISQVDARKGFESGIKYVNAELGGINGHPLEAIICKTDVTPETSVNCANKFVEKDVVLATQGVDFAADAALPILQGAGIVDTSTFAWGPAENRAVDDVYTAFASNEEGYAAGPVQLASMGAESVAVILVDVPAQRAVMDEVVLPAAERLDIKVKPYFYSTPTDWTSFGATVIADHPDAISFFGVEADCRGAIPALRSLGFDGTIHAGSCSTLVDQFTPAELENVIVSNAFYTESMTPVPDEVQDQIDIYRQYSEGADVKESGQAMQGFIAAVWVADMLAQVKGKVTSASVKQGLATAKGKLFFRTNGYDCSAPTWPGTTACGSGFFFTKINDKGETEVLPGQPVDVSAVLPSE